MQRCRQLGVRARKLNLKSCSYEKEEKFDVIKFLIVLGIGMMILSMFCRCTTTKVVPVTEYRDRYINKADTFMLTDSVWLHDSVSVLVKGDTIYTDRWRYKDRYKFVYKNTTDTMVVRDSIPYPVTIEKPLSKMDKYYIVFGKITQGVIFVLIILIVLIDRKDK